MKIDLFRKHKIASMKDFKKKKINLLPPEIHSQKRNARFILIIITIVLVVIVMNIMQYFETVHKIAEVEESILKTQQTIGQLKREKNHVELLKNQMMRIEVKDHVLTALYQENHSPSMVFKLLEANTPKDITYMNVQFSSADQVTISGTSNSENAIADFLYNLKKVTVEQQKFYKDVFVANISKVNNENQSVEYQFNINCEFGGGSDEE